MKKQINEFKRMQQLAGLIKESCLNESSSPYIILWQSSYHGGLFFITKKGKQIQNKIVTSLELELNDDDSEEVLLENINAFKQHPLYPSYKKEIEETKDLIKDNIEYLDEDSDFIKECLNNLN